MAAASNDPLDLTAWFCTACDRMDSFLSPQQEWDRKRYGNEEGKWGFRVHIHCFHLTGCGRVIAATNCSSAGWNWLGIVYNNTGNTDASIDSIDAIDNDNVDHDEYENNKYEEETK